MIFPITNKASDVNVAIIRIANMNNADIDAMNAEVGRLTARQEELGARFKTQQKRWVNYRVSFDAILVQFRVNQGSISEDELAQLLPGFVGKDSI